MNNAGTIAQVFAETALRSRIDAKPVSLTGHRMRGIPPLVDIVDRGAPGIHALGMNDRIIDAREATRASVGHFRCRGRTGEQRREQD